MYASYQAARTADSAVNMKYNVVFVLGGPGAGKGTQCKHIVDEYGYTHLSAGDLLRQERTTPGSEVGELIESHIRAGSIVPVKITCGLLEKAMQTTRDADPSRNNFLIDGFPRNKDNMEGWTEEMDAKVNLQFVLYFDCSDELCIERCMSRGAAGSGRSDDNMESLKKRLETYHTATQPIIDHYNALGLVKRVEAKESAEQVFAMVKPFFENLKNSGDQ